MNLIISKTIWKSRSELSPVLWCDSLTQVSWWTGSSSLMEPSSPLLLPNRLKEMRTEEYLTSTTCYRFATQVQAGHIVTIVFDALKRWAGQPVSIHFQKLQTQYITVMRWFLSSGINSKLIIILANRMLIKAEKKNWLHLFFHSFVRENQSTSDGGFLDK